MAGRLSAKIPGRFGLAATITCALLLCAPGVAAGNSAGTRNAELAKEIQGNAAMRQVHQMAQDLLKGGFNAGSNYHDVWIRDLNTFIQVSLEVNPPAAVRNALLTFFKFQGAYGNVVDGYAPFTPARVSPTTRETPLAPNLIGFKNTVEVDQEPSLAQAVYKYIQITGDRSILDERIGGKTVRERLGLAFDYLLNNRYDPAYGLIWSATRADWGDVQPETNPGVLFGPQSHKAICIYDNAMFLMGVDDYITLLGPDAPETAHWKSVNKGIRRNIRKYLWDKKAQKFYPHIYLDGAPFPKNFDENAIYYFGGTAVAIEAGVLTHKEVRESLRQMDADVKAAHASSVGLTLYPAYPAGFFKNPGMGPYHYQNGGDWTWFGGRVVRGLIEEGDVADAYRELQPMVDRVVRVHGFYEWWTRDDQPRGSANFRGSAGVLGKDIELLDAWAKQN